jgi:hypothetical protein
VTAHAAAQRLNGGGPTISMVGSFSATWRIRPKSTGPESPLLGSLAARRSPREAAAAPVIAAAAVVEDAPSCYRRAVSRVVAIGDLNGAADALEAILRGTRLVDRRGGWTGGGTHLVQVGDLFNRGPHARVAFARLRALRRAARAAGGEVTVLLGNHEAMTALGNESYCTVEEYLSFAPARERARWKERLSRQAIRIIRDHPPGGPMPPLQPRLDAWSALHAPGRREMRRELGPRGVLGRALRSLPIALRIGDTAFVHSVPSPRWARRGIDGLNQAVRDVWAGRPRFWRDLPRTNILRAVDGPLWNRAIVGDATPQARDQLARTLALLGARRIVVGHTQTRHLPGGRHGRIALLHDRRVVCIDVSLGLGQSAPLAALDIRSGNCHEWTPAGRRRLW